MKLARFVLSRCQQPIGFVSLLFFEKYLQEKIVDIHIIAAHHHHITSTLTAPIKFFCNTNRMSHNSNTFHQSWL